LHDTSSLIRTKFTKVSLYIYS